MLRRMPVAPITTAELEAPEQLTLALTATAPRPPNDLRPMLARAAADLPDGRAPYLFDAEWGGLRVLARADELVPRLIGPRGGDLTARFPEVAAGLRHIAVSSGPCLLDGELIVPGADGRPDAAALRARGHGASGPAAAYLCWDLLHVAGRSLLARPLAERRGRLLEVVAPVPHLVPLAPFDADGRELLAAIRGQRWAALVAKRADSPYLPGVRSRLWRRVAAARELGSAGPIAALERERRTPALVALLRLPLG